MATGNWPTLADVTSRFTSDGHLHNIAEMLSQSIVLTQDMPVKEGSEMGGHEFAFRTSIPRGAWRQMNMGTPYAKSTTGKSRVDIAELVAYSQVDRTMARRSGDITGFRESEDVAFLEGMGQTIEETVWYGNTVADPRQFNGLSTFYNTLDPDNAANGANVLDGRGRGSSNASIWLIGWSPRTLFGLYPRGSKAGLYMEDKSDTVPAYDSLGNRFEAYTTFFQQEIGFCPEDWRYGARIANLDVTAAGLAGPNAYDIYTGIRQMMLLLPMMTKNSSGITDSDAPNDAVHGTRPVLYVNRTVRYWMDIQAMRNKGVLMQIKDYAGMPITGFNDIPIKVSDQLLVTEGTVS